MRLQGKFKKHMKTATIFGLLIIDALDKNNIYSDMTNPQLEERSGFSDSLIEKNLALLEVQEKISREKDETGKRRIYISCLTRKEKEITH